jgi:hypothetical protein
LPFAAPEAGGRWVWFSAVPGRIFVKTMRDLRLGCARGETTVSP